MLLDIVSVTMNVTVLYLSKASFRREFLRQCRLDPTGPHPRLKACLLQMIFALSMFVLPRLAVEMVEM